MTNGAQGDLIVVSGPPGSGKSTVSALLSELFDRSVLVEGDQFFAFLRNGRVDPWLPESDRQNSTVIAAAAIACGEFARGGYAVVYDGVVGPWFIDHFLTTTGLKRLHYALLLPAEETCVERVERRRDHPFADPEATRHMHRQFAGSPMNTRHRFGVTNDKDAASVAASIQRAVGAGEILYPG